jgi:hypothetical protein
MSCSGRTVIVVTGFFLLEKPATLPRAVALQLAHNKPKPPGTAGGF